MNHRARQVSKEDLLDFDYLLTMDTMNLEDVNELADELTPAERSKAGKSCTHFGITDLKVQLFGDYRGKGSDLDRIVRDPYYGYLILIV